MSIYYSKTNLVILHISCLLGKSTRSSRRDAGAWTEDRKKRVRETGKEEVKEGRMEEALHSARRRKGTREYARQRGGREERVRPANGGRVESATRVT